MGGILGKQKPKKNDQLEADLAAREAAAADKEKQQQKKQSAILRNTRGRSTGRRTLLSGLETGVTETRKTLG